MYLGHPHRIGRSWIAEYPHARIVPRRRRSQCGFPGFPRGTRGSVAAVWGAVTSLWFAACGPARQYTVPMAVRTTSRIAALKVMRRCESVGVLRIIVAVSQGLRLRKVCP